MNKRESSSRDDMSDKNVEGNVSEFTTARRALDAYPRLRASADFNHHVLARLSVRRTPLELLCERLDTIFARPLPRLCASAIGGMLLGLCGLVLLLCQPSKSTQLDSQGVNIACSFETLVPPDVTLTGDLGFDLYAYQNEILTGYIELKGLSPGAVPEE